MVVECGKCGTRFQLDSSRIPDSGIRVRCSRCKHAFHLQHPSLSQAAAVDAVVQEAIQHEAAPAPNATQDLPIAAVENDSDAGVSAADDYGSIEDEDDWEFNEDPPLEDDEDSHEDQSANQTDDEIDFDLEGEDENEGEDGDEDIDVEGLEADAFGEESANDQYFELADGPSTSDLAEASGVGIESQEIGAEDLTTSSMSVATDVSEEMSAPGQEAAPAPGFGGEREADAFGTVDDFSAPDDEPKQSQQAVAMVVSEEENIEDPESWDFFGEESPVSPAGAGAAQEIAAAPASNQTTDALASESNFDADSDWQELDAGRGSSAISRIASALAMVGVFGLLGAGAYLGIVGSFDPGVRTPAFVAIGEMRAANIRAQWVETERVGTLYVVSGDLVNPGVAAAAPGKAVRVSLVDDRGTDLNVASAFAGTGVEFDFLRSVSYEQLLVSSEADARSLATQSIEPGKTARFSAAFVDLPEDASHFQLSAVAPEAIDEWAAKFGIVSGDAVSAPDAASEAVANDAEPVPAEALSPAHDGAHSL